VRNNIVAQLPEVKASPMGYDFWRARGEARNTIPRHAYDPEI